MGHDYFTIRRGAKKYTSVTTRLFSILSIVATHTQFETFQVIFSRVQSLLVLRFSLAVMTLLSSYVPLLVGDIAIDFIRKLSALKYRMHNQGTPE